MGEEEGEDSEGEEGSWEEWERSEDEEEDWEIRGGKAKQSRIIKDNSIKTLGVQKEGGKEGIDQKIAEVQLELRRQLRGQTGKGKNFIWSLWKMT